MAKGFRFRSRILALALALSVGAAVSPERAAAVEAPTPQKTYVAFFLEGGRARPTAWNTRPTSPLTEPWSETNIAVAAPNPSPTLSRRRHIPEGTPTASPSSPSRFEGHWAIPRLAGEGNAQPLSDR